MMPRESPLAYLLRIGGIRRVDLASRAGMDPATVAPVVRGDARALEKPLSTYIRIAAAMGCSVVELMPELGKRPRSGLLWERGVFRRKPAK